jgi:hypothetical protein
MKNYNNTENILKQKWSLRKTSSSKDVDGIRELYLTSIYVMYIEDLVEKQTDGLWFRVI